MGSGHQATAIFELQLKDGPGPVLAHMHVRVKEPGADGDASEWTGALAADAVVGDFAEASQPTRLAVGITTFADKLRDSPFVDEISWALLQDHLSATVQDLPQHHELIELVAKARELDEYSPRRSMR